MPGTESLPCPCSQVMSDWSFTEKMRGEASTLLERLEAWVEKQNSGMEAAKNPERLQQSFESLLKVMDALYQVGGARIEARCVVILCCVFAMHAKELQAQHAWDVQGG